MKALFLISALLLSASTSFAAQDLLKDPMSCGNEFKKTVVFHFDQPSFFTVKHRTLKLKFDQRGVLTYATDASDDVVRETLDGNSLSSKWIHDGKAGVSGCNGMAVACAHGMANILGKFDLAWKNRAKDSVDGEHQRAMSCARSIALSFMNKSFKSEEEIGFEDAQPLKQMTSDAGKSLEGRIKSIAQTEMKPMDYVKKTSGGAR